MIRDVLPSEAAPVLLHLRPHFADAAALAAAAEAQRADGYRLAASFSETGEVAAVAGFRVTRNLASGPHLYVDDLVTAPEHRRRGHAGALLDWCRDEAARLGCASLELDSGVGPDRRDAHALYFAKGMGIRFHHFIRDLP